ncbi:MAG: twin-arginine translocase TatA/TatE family subunit [Spirochaetota bacterium]
MIGTTEIFIIVAVVLVLFGSAAIPKFARSLGEAKKELAKAKKEDEASADLPADKSVAKKDTTA